MRKMLLFSLFALVIPSKAGPPPLIASWSMDAAKHIVTLHLANRTGKDITAYNIKIKETYGTRTNEQELSTDTVALMFNIQDRAGTPEGDRWQKNFGNGTFPSGSTKDDVIHVQAGLNDFSAIVDTVIYVDKTAETTNPDALKRLLDARAAFAASIQAGNDIIQKALANPNDANPHETALKQIQQMQADWEANHHQGNFNAGALHEVMQDLKYAGTAAPQRGQSVREYLNDYVAKRSERAARLLEHAKAGAQ